MKLFKLKATEQDFPVVMFILLYIMVLTFESVDEIRSVIIQREATKQYDSVERRSLLHPNTAQGSVFPLQSYSKKTLRKNQGHPMKTFGKISVKYLFGRRFET